MKKKELINELKQHDYNYHTLGQPTITDIQYDKLKNELYKLDPKNPYFHRVGADIPNSIKLPYYLGSLNKIRDDQHAINNWIKKHKGPYYVSEKLDGISALYDIKNNKMYSRGNGTYGSDISYVISYINMMYHDTHSSILNYNYIRGELIIPNKKWTPDMGTNPRNTVAGVVNAKILNHKILSKIDFVPYTIIEPLSSVEQIENIDNHVKIEQIDNLTIENLQKTLQEWKLSSEYEIDGIVITQQGEYQIQTGTNPKHAFAFKSINTHQITDVTVTHVEWNQSKSGLLKPRVLFDKVYIDGAYISATTGHNARFIEDNKIGVGAVISIIRSGGVIPKIQHVVKHADTISMPSVNWKWNDTHVEAIAITENHEQKIQEILNFFKKLDVKGIGKKLIENLYKNGYTDIDIILQSNFDELDAKGIGSKTILLLKDTVSNIKSQSSLLDIMVASNIFKSGIGEKKLKIILDKIPDIMTANIVTIKNIDGIGDTTSKQFLDNFEQFKQFYHRHFSIKNTNTNINTNNDKYKHHNIVFTGFRDKELEKQISNCGGKISSSVSSNTTIVVAKDVNGTSATLKKARENGITILDKQSLLHILSISL